ncbi:MAG: UDP-N-acetylglucosamine 1-carboxyvinyltransferase [bacterium]
MDKFVIRGSQPLKGQLKVEGSKNAALPIIAGALLIDAGETVIRNIPPLRDIFTIIKVIEYLGAKVDYDASKQVMSIRAEQLTQNDAPYDLMRQMRASFLMLGPILARQGSARISLPGGCVLGARPVNFHIKAFQAMGAKVTEDGGFVLAKGSPLAGGQVYFDRPSHTGTENVLFGAVLAKGKTRIVNAACDPEVIDVAEFLNKAGARISGAGTPIITVEPVRRLKALEFRVQGDRLVAGTFMFGAAMTKGDVRLKGINPLCLEVVIQKLREMGCQVDSTHNGLRVRGPKRLKAVSITTFPYPGFPTDLQACAMAATCLADGTSHIRETVFSDRFSHTMEMSRLGADITIAGDEAVIVGVPKLTGAKIMASDIRAGAGIILAALAAKGNSEVLRVYHVDRGYSQIEEKLTALGADVTRVKE